MGFIKEFKEFAIRGNLVDLAVGVVIGSAFGKLVTSLIEGVVMPPIGKLLGNVDFNRLQYIIQKNTPEVKNTDGKVVFEAMPEIAIKYGLFINTILDFIIIAFAMFLVIKGMNTMRRKHAIAAKPEVEPTKEELLLTEIRDLLKK